MTVSMPMAEVVPVVAVKVTGVLLLTAPPVTVNVWDFTPAGTVTDPGAGTGATAGSPLLRPTTSPPVGAFALSITVPVDTCPEAMLAGLKDNIVTTGEITVSPPPAEAPLGSVAITVTGVLLATGSEFAVNVPLVAEPAMLKLLGTVTAFVLSLTSVTVKPAGGAGPFKFTVPIELLPPVTVLGLNVNDEMMAGSTVSVPFTLLDPNVAVTVTGSAMATPTVVAVKVVDVFVAGTKTLAGTMTTEGAPLLRVTVSPPVGAA